MKKPIIIVIYCTVGGARLKQTKHVYSTVYLWITKGVGRWGLRGPEAPLYFFSPP